MPGLIITEFENIEMEPDKGTIDQNKSKQLNEANSKNRYKNLNIGDDDEYIDASKKNRDVSDVKGGVKGGEPIGNELERIQKIQKNGENCRSDATEVIIQKDIPKPPPKENEKKKQILGVDPNKCHIADDTGLNEFQKQIVFSAVFFLLMQNEYDVVKKTKTVKEGNKNVKKEYETKRQWERIGNMGYGTEKPMYPIVTPQEFVTDYSGYEKGAFSGNPIAETAWCAAAVSAFIHHALIEVDYVPDDKYVAKDDSALWHVPFFMSKFSMKYPPKRFKSWYTIPPTKLNKGTAFIYSAGASRIYEAQVENGCPHDNTPKPGSIFFRSKKEGSKGSGHAGLVVWVDPSNGDMYTIEANSGDDCKLQKYTAEQQESPVGSNNLKGGYKDKHYFAHVWKWDKIKWTGKSKGLDLTKKLSPYHPELPFSRNIHSHLNKVWTNPLELIKALKKTTWDYGVWGKGDSDR